MDGKPGSTTATRAVMSMDRPIAFMEGSSMKMSDRLVGG
jgi:hypothetical protein